MQHERPAVGMPPPPNKRRRQNIGLELAYEPAAFTQNEKLLWLTQDRVSKALDDNQWSDVNLSQKRFYFEKVDPISIEVYSPQKYVKNEECKENNNNNNNKEYVNDESKFECGDIIVRPLFDKMLKDSKNKWEKCKVGDKFGPSWASHWFKIQLSPKSEWMDNKEAEIHLCFNCSSEATLYAENGDCISGFAGGTDQLRCEYVLQYPSKNLKPQWPLTLYVEMSCNHPFGCGNEFLDPPPKDRTFELKTCDLGLFNREAWNLIWDLRVLYNVSQELPHKYTQQSLTALRVCNEILNSVNWLDSKTYSKGREIAYNNFYKYKNGESQFTVNAIGHCHIDTAWLWPYGETRRKIRRSWASQMKLIELYPSYHFGASQAQHYEWLLEDCPLLFDRIRKETMKSSNERQFHIVGGTWVEMDCNVPCGESFVRQFLYGQRFFELHFGRRCEIFWLPDTFGYSAQLPQIIKLSDMKYFFTQKLSWNLINQFSHHSFIWQGIDGTDVLVHFAPADTYVSQCKIGDLVKSKEDYKNKSCNNESLLVHGWGDGGGGPTWEHIERLKRCENVDGVPKVEMSSANVLFDKLEKSMNKLARWNGELYFEMHRGTYTTHSQIKYGNRIGEYLLQCCEFIHGILDIYKKNEIKDYQYPQNEIYRSWCDLLLNQFHDVLPGSSIELANIDARNIYKKLRNTINKVIDDGKTSLVSLTKNLNGNNNENNNDNNNENNSHCFGSIINTKSWQRNEIIEIDSNIIGNGNNDDDKLTKTLLNNNLVQKCYNDKKLLMYVSAPSLGVASLTPQDIGNDGTKYARIGNSKDNKSIEMENEFIIVSVNKENGMITSMIYKPCDNRQVIDINNESKSFGNNFLLFDDKPLFWDAWDVEIFHLQKYKSISSESKNVTNLKIIENGPLRCGLSYNLKISDKSSLECRMFVEYNNPSVLFSCDIDWNERHEMLKVEFPLNVKSDQATYEIQYGFIDRTTTMNTTHDIAAFEVCAQRWGNLEEFGFGAALLNNCKYGYSCHSNFMRLSLLRSPKRPDGNADIHKHFNVNYRLVPHNGSFQNNKIIQRAHAMNSDFIICSNNNNNNNNGSIGAPISLFSTDKDSIIIDTVKRCENLLNKNGSISDNNDNAIVLRLYESYGGRCNCNLLINLPKLEIDKAYIVNLMEDHLQQVEINNNNQMALYFEPFEIKSIKLMIK